MPRGSQRRLLKRVLFAYFDLLCIINLSWVRLFFLLWSPLGVLSSQASGQIGATVVTCAAAAATPDPLTRCARLGMNLCPGAPGTLPPILCQLPSLFKMLRRMACLQSQRFAPLSAWVELAACQPALSCQPLGVSHHLLPCPGFTAGSGGPAPPVAS